MNVYVESNFILELALLQEQAISCEGILGLCEQGDADLVVPAFCLTEPYDTIIRRHRQRMRVRSDLDVELGQLARSVTYKGQATAIKEDILAFLIDSLEEEQSRLNSALRRVLEVAELIPLDLDVVLHAQIYQSSIGMSPQDSLVYTSVLSHLEGNPGTDSCFLNRNSRDFDDPYVVQQLEDRGCKMLFNFDTGLRYLTRFSTEASRQDG